MRNSNSPSENRDVLLAKAEKQSKKDRNKLITMCAGLIMVIIAFAYSSLQGSNQESKLEVLVGEPPQFVETTIVEQFDISSVAGLITDTRTEDRVLLPSTVTDPLTDYVFGMKDAQFHALGVEDLTADRRAQIEAAPADFRGQPYRVRGQLEDIRSRKRLDGKTEYRGWLRDEDNTLTHFLSMGVPKEINLKSRLRFEGLFVQLYRAEGPAGEIINAPLLIGARLVNSHNSLTAEDLTPEALITALSRVKDDKARNSVGLDGPVYDVQWKLMEYAKTDAYKAIDWDKDAVELTNETMAAILSDGDAWRYRRAGDPDPRAESSVDITLPPLTEDMVPIPIRLPVSRNMGINTLDAGENPANIDVISEGWIGNFSWSNQAGIAYFVYPGARKDLLDREKVTFLEAKGFFVKNHNYESRDKGTRTAPFFVFTELTEFAPVKSMLAEDMMLWILGIAIVLLIAFPLLLIRDRKKSAELQRDLVRRKQERRRRLSTADQPQV
jgi:hypothetical protein